MKPYHRLSGFAPRWRRPGGLGIAAGVVILSAGLIRLQAEATAAPDSRAEIHFAFSKSMFAGVNETDARAAMRVYAQTIGDQNGLFVDSAPVLLEGTNAIARAAASGQVEMFALTAGEFLQLEGLGLQGPLLCSKIRDQVTEEYLLLVREKDAIQKIADLKGHSLIMLDDVRGCLAPYWLEVLCRENGLGAARDGFARITTSSKATQVVLPVFFGKADACVVTRNGWDVMCELNPQLSKTLRIVATSTPVVPALTCFGPGVTPEFRQRVIKAWELSRPNAAYQQLMTLFKTDSVGYQPLAAMESTRALLARYRKLVDGVSGAPAPAPPTATAKEGVGK